MFPSVCRQPIKLVYPLLQKVVYLLVSLVSLENPLLQKGVYLHIPLEIGHVGFEILSIGVTTVFTFHGDFVDRRMLPVVFGRHVGARLLHQEFHNLPSVGSSTVVARDVEWSVLPAATASVHVGTKLLYQNCTAGRSPR